MVFDTTANSYSIIDTTTGIPIAHPADSMPFTNNFSTGRNSELDGVSVLSVTMGSAPMTVLQFDAYGRPIITADLVVTLLYNGYSMNITVKAGTGDVSISGAVQNPRV
jgi:hypothetical protein